MKILIKNANVLDMVGDSPNIKKEDILIKDNIIDKIDQSIDEEADEIIDAKNNLLMPGLVNTHTHIPMALFRGYKDEKKLEDWLFNAIFPVEGKLSDEDVYYNSYLSCIELIKSGTTTINDMYFKTQNVIKAIEETGLRGCVCWCTHDMLIEDHVERSLENAKKYNNDPNSRIKVFASFHAPYTCSKSTIKLITDLADEIKMPIHLHLSETKTEEKTIQEKYNKSATKYLYDLGVFNHPVILAHGIHFSDDDLELLKDIKGGISHNPISNSKLASGVCDVVKLKKKGFNIGLGTDGQGSTTTLDMFDEMRTCAYHQKLKYEDPTIIKAYDILKMATIEGAKVIGLDKEIGTIEVGKKADMIIIDINQIHMWPHNDICTNLVYSANGEDVITTIVDGKILMKDRKLVNIDEEDIMNKVKELSNNLLDAI